MGTRPLDRRIGRTIERHRLIPPGGRVIVALSGGGDSVALAALLCELAASTPWSVAAVLHINHGLRAAADDDEAFCRRLAGRLGLPIAVEHVDVRAYARAARVSIEEAGHRLRHARYRRAVANGDGDRVATGHTRDDLAETVLLRLIRGSGPGGLAAIRPRRGCVIRPLLDVTRTELRAALGARGLAYREDETNADLRVPRNRVRHRLLPFLAEHFSPTVVEALARQAEIARADADWLAEAANDAAGRLVLYNEGYAEVDASRLAAEPLALARRVAKQVLERIGGRPVEFAHVERFLAMIRTPAPSGGGPIEIDFPGSRACRRGARVRVGAPAQRTRAVPEPFAYPLAVPGAVDVPEAGVVISAAAAARRPALSARGPLVGVRLDGLATPLTVRSWRPGDVVRPLGLGGRKKLQDFFVDRKIARARRHHVPIVADARGAIVWVVGETVADEFRLTGLDRGVLILKAMTLGRSE